MDRRKTPVEVAARVKRGRKWEYVRSTLKANPRWGNWTEKWGKVAEDRAAEFFIDDATAVNRR